MCGLSLSFWIKNTGGDDKNYKPKIRYMTPIFCTEARGGKGMSKTSRMLYPGPVTANAQYWSNTMGLATKKV